jgi:hypothetical protein
LTICGKLQIVNRFYPPSACAGVKALFVGGLQRAVSNGMLHRVTTPPPANMCPQGGGKHYARIIEWVWKSFHYIYVLLTLWIGIFLVVFPWRQSWENNYLVYLYPQIRPLVANPFLKGFVLGLGIVNFLIGIHEIVQIKKDWESRHLSR